MMAARSRACEVEHAHVHVLDAVDAAPGAARAPERANATNSDSDAENETAEEWGQLAEAHEHMLQLETRLELARGGGLALLPSACSQTIL